jgi:hypothetical protein
MGLKSSLIAVVNLTLWFTMYMFNERAKCFCESVYILYYKHNVLLHGLICSCGTFSVRPRIQICQEVVKIYRWRVFGMDSIVMLAIKLDILYSEIAQLPYFCRMDGRATCRHIWTQGLTEVLGYDDLRLMLFVYG